MFSLSTEMGGEETKKSFNDIQGEAPPPVLCRGRRSADCLTSLTARYCPDRHGCAGAGTGHGWGENELLGRRRHARQRYEYHGEDVHDVKRR